jgi:hypothetical protein
MKVLFSGILHSAVILDLSISFPVGSYNLKSRGLINCGTGFIEDVGDTPLALYLNT